MMLFLLGMTAANFVFDPNLPALPEVPLPAAQLLEQGEAIKKSIRPVDLSFMPPEVTKESLIASGKKAAEDAVSPTLNKLSQQALSKAESIDWPTTDKFDPIPVPSVLPRKDLQTKTYKDWKAKYGDKDNISAEANAYFRMSGNKEMTQADAEAWTEIGIFGSKNFRILNAHGIVQAPQRGNMQLEGQIWILGFTLMDESGTKKMPLIEKSDEREETILNVEKKFRFTVGPVPMSGKIGAQGTSGIAYTFMASPLAASTYIKPFIKANAFAEVAVDIEVASAGIGGKLLLCEASAELKASATADFDAQGDLKLTTSLTSNAAVHMLDGELYGFVEMLLPAKRWEKDLYRWTGIQKEFGNAVNFKKVTGASLIAVEGDADDEDFTATDLDRHERELADSIHNELVDTAPAVDSAFSTTFSALTSLSDTKLDQFWKRYQQI